MICLTKTQKVGIALWNEKLQTAQMQLQQIHEGAKAFLRDVVEEAGEDSSLPWIFDAEKQTLSLAELKPA